MPMVCRTRTADDLTAERVLPATLLRGGTSKCWIFRRSDLPSDQSALDELLIRAFGSPDVRQIDGVGGGSSTTSKALIVDDLDEDGTLPYVFAQVAIDKPSVEYDSNCGNCATGLGLFALHSGVVATTGDLTRVAILNTATGLRNICEIPTPDGRVPVTGERRLDGQVYPGVPVDVIFTKDSWSSFGIELPTGHAVDEVEVEGKRYSATLIDAGAPAALFDAAAFGLTGSEDIGDLDVVLHLAPQLRAEAARMMNLPVGLTSIPKVGIVGPPPAGTDGVSARMISMSAFHPAIGLTSAVAIAAASGTPDSLVDRARVRTDGSSMQLPIHLFNSIATPTLDGATPSEVAFQRSARVLVEGSVFVPND